MKKMKFCHRRVFYLDLGFNTTKMEVLCWQVFYVIGGHCILLPRERGRNLDSKAILTKDEQCALVLYKNTKNTDIGQMYKWNRDKWEEKLVSRCTGTKPNSSHTYLCSYFNGHF